MAQEARALVQEEPKVVRDFSRPEERAKLLQKTPRGATPRVSVQPGDRYGGLVILSVRPAGDGNRVAVARCDCGRTFEIRAQRVTYLARHFRHPVCTSCARKRAEAANNTHRRRMYRELWEQNQSLYWPGYDDFEKAMLRQAFEARFGHIYSTESRSLDDTFNEEHKRSVTDPWRVAASYLAELYKGRWEEFEVIQGMEMTLEEIGTVLGLTRERVRQIEEIALMKLHVALTGKPHPDYAEWFRRYTNKHKKRRQTDDV